MGWEYENDGTTKNHPLPVGLPSEASLWVYQGMVVHCHDLAGLSLQACCFAVNWDAFECLQDCPFLEEEAVLQWRWACDFLIAPVAFLSASSAAVA